VGLGRPGLNCGKAALGPRSLARTVKLLREATVAMKARQERVCLGGTAAVTTLSRHPAPFYTPPLAAELDSLNRDLRGLPRSGPASVR
jgi:hypothetical protein